MNCSEMNALWIIDTVSLTITSIYYRFPPPKALKKVFPIEYHTDILRMFNLELQVLV